tara:strand:+ start:101 stop:292 length:192 start_codon:yes stop_codon:yes gene_type:complete
MTDKQILAEVYRRLQGYCPSFRSEGHLGVNRYDVKDFIEQEWMKRDEVVCSEMELTLKKKAAK